MVYPLTVFVLFYKMGLEGRGGEEGKWCEIGVGNWQRKWEETEGRMEFNYC